MTDKKHEEEWQLVWKEEFTTNHIDQATWNFVEGGWGFGNKELQHYTNRQQNARIENNQLIIEAHKENYQDNPYTSAKLTTKGKHDWLYGRFEIKAKLPKGLGIWPAIWMMPTDMELYSGWPACGEIDIMEAIGHEPDKVYGTIHYGVPHTFKGSYYRLPLGENFQDDFHVFAIEWEENEIRWYVDDELYGTQTNWFSKDKQTEESHPFPAPFNRTFYLQLNLAVGGEWPGYPDGTTQFPQQMTVDYIKVYQKSN